MSTGTAYVLAEWLRNEAVCTCGWKGKRRLLQGQAVLDAILHCADSGHTPAGTAPDDQGAVPVVERYRVGAHVGSESSGDADSGTAAPFV